MEELFGNVTIAQVAAWLLAIAAAIVSISKAWEIVRKIFHPDADLRDRVDKHDEILANDHQRLKKIEAKLEDTDKFKGVVCRAMLAQLEDDNEAGKKEAKKELNSYLTQR